MGAQENEIDNSNIWNSSSLDKDMKLEFEPLRVSKDGNLVEIFPFELRSERRILSVMEAEA